MYVCMYVCPLKYISIILCHMYFVYICLCTNSMHCMHACMYIYMYVCTYVCILGPRTANFLQCASFFNSLKSLIKLPGVIHNMCVYCYQNGYMHTVGAVPASPTFCSCALFSKPPRLEIMLPCSQHSDSSGVDCKPLMEVIIFWNSHSLRNLGQPWANVYTTWMYVCMQRIHTLILLYRNNSMLIYGRIHTHIPLNDPIFFNLFLCINKSLSIGSSKFSITEMSWSHIHKLVRVIATGERFEMRWIPLFKTAEAINIKVFKLCNVSMYICR